MLVTAAVFHLLMSWLKEVASPNILNMFFTDPVLHVLMSWLKTEALENMFFMDATLPVSAQERALPPLLKAVASTNMYSMVVAEATFHLLMSLLKEEAPKKMP